LSRPHLLPKIKPTTALPSIRPVWTPQPGTQTALDESAADITGFGGRAGGGKSSALVGEALTRHRRTIIFRRESKQGRDMFEHALELIAAAGVDAKVNRGPSPTVYLPDGDRRLEFAGVKNPDDWRKYMGRARDGYFFDEVSEFPEEAVRALIGWNRSAISGQRCRVIMTFNPPGRKSGQWLKSFFGPWVNKRDPHYPTPFGALRWYTTVGAVDFECEDGRPREIVKVGGGEALKERCDAPVDIEGHCEACGCNVVTPLSRTFIESKLSDNAYLRDTNYRDQLNALPSTLRSQLRDGNFDAEDLDEADQCIPTKWLLDAFDRGAKMERPDAPLSAIGADPARGGKDQTAFVARIGTWFDSPVTFPGADTDDGPKVLAKLVEFARGYRVNGKALVGMDVIGIGSSPLDFARLNNINVIAMVASDAAPEGATDRSGMLGFANLRSWWYWSLREALDPTNGEDLAIVPNQELLVDLCAARYHVGLKGIQVDPKDDIKKIIGRSPDCGDAFVYAFAVRPFIVGYRTVTTRSAGPKAFAPAREKRDRWRR